MEVFSLRHRDIFINDSVTMKAKLLRKWGFFHSVSQMAGVQKDLHVFLLTKCQDT